MLNLNRMGTGKKLLHQASLMNGSGIEKLKRLSKSEISKMQNNARYIPTRTPKTP